ncbi:ChrR family anti-sigma-E factor [Maritalea mediterranea]|uniref:ChrR family anti-sigma-E factor n=1 Tax=Maritalea mediterranea TaxID=2909667 RepID=A0ABS9E8C9_9HYPH|nr:ChrR family anti-sigma-E factor [Maritalea mediterranea]MCF4099145.1 ChrR family anti-sigma-E factor [Maritalea mediterranea]
MNIHHHLDEATLLRYASGDLDSAFTMVVAAHLAMCDSCRQAARDAEEIGGHMMDRVAQAPVSSNAFEKMMARIDAGQDEQIEVDVSRHKKADSDVPLPLRNLIGDHLDDVRWRLVAPGVRKHEIKMGKKGESSLYMLNISPGMAMPEHGHGGAEMTLILSGAYRDKLGVFGPGDVADLDEHIEHQPVVEPGEACICLVATETPTRFKDFIVRLMQPFVRI